MSRMFRAFLAAAAVAAPSLSPIAAGAPTYALASRASWS
jgi:hypothetical protein